MPFTKGMTPINKGKKKDEWIRFTPKFVQPVKKK